MTAPAAWGIPQREHTFASGRVAILREQLPLHVLVRTATADDDLDLLESLRRLESGDLTDPGAAIRLQDAIVSAMFIRPRVVLQGAEDLADGEDTVTIDAIRDEELDEVVAMAMEGVADAARFRGDAGGSGGRKDGASVAKGAKRGARTPARKSRGAGTRR